MKRLNDTDLAEMIGGLKKEETKRLFEEAGKQIERIRKTRKKKARKEGK